MSKVAKVIELVGTSSSGLEDAVQVAVNEAAKSVRNITGVEITNMTAHVNNNQVTEWRATVKVAFGIEGNASS
ncbi:MAG: hypothetical protein CL607_21915 [Anaerolineaceae bacterium]|nr:hypothetical protein [Anaerolineaceae bacterium]